MSFAMKPQAHIAAIEPPSGERPTCLVGSIER